MCKHAIIGKKPWSLQKQYSHLKVDEQIWCELPKDETVACINLLQMQPLIAANNPVEERTYSLTMTQTTISC